MLVNKLRSEVAALIVLLAIGACNSTWDPWLIFRSRQCASQGLACPMGQVCNSQTDQCEPLNPAGMSICASINAEAAILRKSVDIIFIIDNSGSMSDKALSVNNNINMSFASIIESSGLDYRVVMVTRHGAYNGASKAVCITQPLSTLTSCNPTPSLPGINSPKFYHYSRQIESTDAFRRLLATYNGAEADEFRLAPMGWSQWLRTDAFKVFVMISDDGSDMDENTFETQLFSKTPKMFGDATNRNYIWHSIVGLKENSPATKPWQPTDPVQTLLCTSGGGAYDAGQIYQRLSILTGGLRFPICEHASFDEVFRRIATGIIDAVTCDFQVPTPPPGQMLDLNSVSLEYTPMGTSIPEAFQHVASSDQCVSNAFYVENNHIYICPETCNAIRQDGQAKVQVLFRCRS